MSLLTTKEVSQYLGVSERTIFNWRSEGMPYKKIGKVIRFDSGEVEKWVDEQSE